MAAVHQCGLASLFPGKVASKTAVWGPNPVSFLIRINHHCSHVERGREAQGRGRSRQGTVEWLASEAGQAGARGLGAATVHPRRCPCPAPAQWGLTLSLAHGLELWVLSAGPIFCTKESATHGGCLTGSSCFQVFLYLSYTGHQQGPEFSDQQKNHKILHLCSSWQPEWSRNRLCITPCVLKGTGCKL